MKRNPSEICAQVFLVSLMTLIIIITLYPLVHVIFASISQPNLLAAHRGPMLAPLGISSLPYELLFNNRFILSGLGNSLLLIVGGVSCNILMTAIAAYVLSKRYARLTKVFTVCIMFTMLFSGGLIPLYLTVRSMGMYNNYLALILPFAVSTFNLIILRTAFEGVPVSLEESARMDGAGHFTILFRITIPVVMPMIAVMILYYAVDRWNGWFYASVFLKDRSLYPLQLILRDLLLEGEAGSMLAASDNADMMLQMQSVKYAAIVVGTLPVLALYPFLQRWFIRDSLAGSVKE